MRVISGIYRGRKIECPKGYRIRPTSDMVRSAVFNILFNYVDWEETNVLDVFCGTGAYGIEALSHGAKHAGFVDNHRESIEVTKYNLAKIHDGKNVTVYPYDALQLPSADKKYGVVLIDPPYKTNAAPKVLNSLKNADWLDEGAILVVEDGEREKIEIPEGFEEITSRRYGNTQLKILKYLK